MPGPFSAIHGQEFVRWVGELLEEALRRSGLGDYVHPWTFLKPDSEEWECLINVTDIRRDVALTRETLAGHKLHAGSVIVVWSPEERPLRTYSLAQWDDTADWADLSDVEAKARYSIQEAVHRTSPC